LIRKVEGIFPSDHHAVWAELMFAATRQTP